MYLFFFVNYKKVILLFFIYWVVIGREGLSEKLYENKIYNIGFISFVLL